MRTLPALGALAGLAIVTVVAPAVRADDDKAACRAAYDATQTLRANANFGAARAQALTCAREVCADFVRVDCAKWLEEIELATPTIVLAVRGADGAETTKVRVALDGKPWLQAVDGTARPLDPGPHALHFEIDGATAIDQRIVVRENEKARVVAVSFATAPAPPAPALPPVSLAPLSQPVDAATGTPAWVWPVGGLGLAALGVSLAFDISAISANSKIGNCPIKKNVPTCSGGESLSHQQDVGAAVGIAGGIAGAALVTAAIVGLARSGKPSPAAALYVTPELGPRQAGLGLLGSF